MTVFNAAAIILYLAAVVIVISCSRRSIKKGKKPGNASAPLNRQLQGNKTGITWFETPQASAKPDGSAGSYAEAAQGRVIPGSSYAAASTLINETLSGRTSGAGALFGRHYAIKQDGLQVHDSSNDWLTRQLIEESRSYNRISAMLGLKLEHSSGCDARALKLEHLREHGTR